jgi:hypothetical protein
VCFGLAEIMMVKMDKEAAKELGGKIAAGFIFCASAYLLTHNQEIWAYVFMILAMVI